MSAELIERVGVVGLGRMGAGIAESLLRKGRDLSVYDLRSEALARFRGRARIASTPADLASECDAVIVAVVNAKQVRDVLAGKTGLIAGANRRLIAIVVSTVSAESLLELADLANKGRVTLLDAGITGGQGGAEAGTLVSLVGGDVAQFDLARPVLEDFSSLVVHFGPLGSGVKAKVVRSLITYITICAAYEGRRLANRAGVDLDKLAEVVRVSDGYIGGVATYLGRVQATAPNPAADPDAYRRVEASMVDLYLDLQAGQAEADVTGMRVSIAKLVNGIPELLG